MHAVDVRSGKLLWKYDPHVGIRKMRMAWGLRGLTYWNGKIYAGVQDGRLFALDAKTGALVWEPHTTEPDDTRYITGAPRVWPCSAVRAALLIRPRCPDLAHCRGSLTGYDARTRPRTF